MRMTRSMSAVLLGLVVAAVGCKQQPAGTTPAPQPAVPQSTPVPGEPSAPAEPSPTGGATSRAAPGAGCPLASPPDAVAVVDTPDGAALVVITQDNHDALRSQLDQSAKRHNATGGKSARPDEVASSVSTQSKARVEETPEAIAIVFGTPDQTSVPGLRSEVREAAVELNQACPPQL